MSQAVSSELVEVVKFCIYFMEMFTGASMWTVACQEEASGFKFGDSQGLCHSLYVVAPALGC